MKLKRFLCAALSVTMLSGAAFAAGGLNSLPVAPGPAEMPQYEVDRRNDDASIMVWGSAKEKGESDIYLENSNEGAAFSQIIIKVNEDTAIVDAVTGAAKTFADIREGETLYAWVSPAMTRSIPPQTNAAVVVCNLPADFGAPQYAQVQKVTKREDGGTDVLMSNSVILHLNADTELMSYQTKDIKTLADVKPGTMLLSWYHMVALSMPAQATPTKVMVFPYTYDGYVDALPGTLSVNGEKVELGADEAPFVQEGKLMVPVRKLAEALGCEVKWDAETPTAVIVERNGEHLYTITVGAPTMLRESDMVVDVATPAQARARTTFACLDDLLVAHNVKAETLSMMG